MIISATFSKPVPDVEGILGRAYLRIRVKALNSGGKTLYYFESFTEKQAFHSTKTLEEFEKFIVEHAGTTFKNVTIRTEKDETTVLANRRGRITRFSRPLGTSSLNFQAEKQAEKTEDFLKNRKSRGKSVKDSVFLTGSGCSTANRIIFSDGSPSRRKNYIIQEGEAVPFMVLLGIMNANGRVVSSKYDKFRQINRFLEFIDDILPEVLSQKDSSAPLRIEDFGSGKSYLTFAVHHYLKK